jgi:hypothetical protein
MAGDLTREEAERLAKKAVQSCANRSGHTGTVWYYGVALERAFTDLLLSVAGSAREKEREECVKLACSLCYVGDSPLEDGTLHWWHKKLTILGRPIPDVLCSASAIRRRAAGEEKHGRV